VAAGLAASLKVFPIVLTFWLGMRRAWREVYVCLAVLLAGAIIGIFGAGLHATSVFVRIALGGHVHPTVLSLPGLIAGLFHVSTMGLVRYATLAALPLGLAAAWLLRRWPRASFAVAILTSIWVSPTVYEGNYALLLAAAAPWEITWRQRPLVRPLDPQAAVPRRGASIVRLA